MAQRCGPVFGMSRSCFRAAFPRHNRSSSAWTSTGALPGAPASRFSPTRRVNVDKPIRTSSAISRSVQPLSSARRTASRRAYGVDLLASFVEQLLGSSDGALSFFPHKYSPVDLLVSEHHEGDVCPANSDAVDVVQQPEAQINSSKPTRSRRRCHLHGRTDRYLDHRRTASDGGGADAMADPAGVLRGAGKTRRRSRRWWSSDARARSR
ncbi:hypothetical protein SAMN04488003_14410 [Loktanella fryxellensis]|uniref:Uncharacterized protein n=1 Tax=Loktanella fryxellensis TaxID=245187 RepID=A0A1H8JVY2_9RHOB|nr:hypothetical protein SAMN04488003_14410 [Loktanella fryxellensis]